MFSRFQEGDSVALIRELTVKVTRDFEITLPEETHGVFVDYDKSNKEHIIVELILENGERVKINSHNMFWGVELD